MRKCSRTVCFFGRKCAWEGSAVTTLSPAPFHAPPFGCSCSCSCCCFCPCFVLICVLLLSSPLDQGPVASVFWLDDALESVLRLDAIVTLVDAKNIQRQLQRVPEREGEAGEDAAVGQQGKGLRNEAAMQIAYADRVVINKVRI